MTIPGSSPFTNPPNNQPSLKRVSRERAPTPNDNRNFREGDEWLDTSSNDWWKLTSLAEGIALWVRIGGTAASVEEFVVSSGTSPVVPNEDNQITIQDGNGIGWTGGTNSMQANSTLSYASDSGTATAAASTITFAGGTNINTSASANTVTTNLDTSVTGLTFLNVDNVDVDGNTVSTTSGDLILSPTNLVNINSAYTIPSADGSANQILITDGAGTLSFSDVIVPSGGVLQTIYASSSSSVSSLGGTTGDLYGFNNTIPTISTGLTVLTADITPNSASNFLLVTYSCYGSIESGISNPGDSQIIHAFFQDATSNAVYASTHAAARGPPTQAQVSLMTGSFRISAGTVSQTTITWKVGKTADAFGLIINGFLTGGPPFTPNELFGAAGLTTLRVQEIQA